MKLKLILNPASGKAKRCWPVIEKFFEEKNIPFDLDRTSGPGQGTLLAKKAVEAGFDAIVSVGGDGLASEIANGIVGSEATLGVIPCGEANDFPKMLGITEKNVEEACRIVAEGFTRKIDVGMINGRYFLNVVGIGYDGEVTEQKAKIKKHAGGFFGYFIQAILTTLTYKPKLVKIKMDGVTFEASILLLTIGNGRFCGGGFLLTPNAEIDDGLLDVCLIKYPGKLWVLWDLPKVPKGKHVGRLHTTVFRTREIEVSSEDLLIIHIDGEIAKGHEFKIKVLPQKLKVLVKKSAEMYT